MADAKGIRAGRAFVELFADDSKLVRGLKRASAKLKAFGESVRGMGLKLTAIGSAVAAPLVASAKVFADFETQMKMVSTMLDEPEKHMDAFTAGIRRLSVEFGESTDVLAKGLYDLLSASVDPAAAMGVLEVAVRSAKGGMTDTAVAVDGLTSVMNAFGMAAGEAGRVADVMFATVKRGKLTFPDLAANIGKVAPMARAAGMSMEDMMAAIATMTRQGLNAEESTTRLVNILKQAPGDAKNIAALVQKYVGKDLEQIQIDFPEVRAAGGIAALAADMSGFLKDLDLMQNATGKADEAFGRMTGGVAGDFKKIKMAVIDLGVTIGEALAPTIKAAAEWLKKVAAVAGEWLKQNKELIVTVLKVAAAVIAAGVGLIVLGTIIAGVGKALAVLAAVVTGVGTVFKLMGAVLMWMLSPVGMVITAVAALGAYIVYATGAGGKALAWLGDRWNELKDDAVAAYGGIADALAAGDIGLAARILWLTLKMEWTKGVNWISAIWNGALLWLRQRATEAFYGLVMGLEYIWHGLEVAWIETTAFLSKVWMNFCTGIHQAWMWVGKSLTQTWNKLKGTFDKNFNADAANAVVEQGYQKARDEMWNQAKQQLGEREAQRARERDDAAKVHEGTINELVHQGEGEKQRLQDQYDQKMKSNQDELDAAKKEWQDALKAAKDKRQQKESQGPEPLEGPEGLMEKLRKGAAGLDDLLGQTVQKTIGAAGTFSAREASLMSAGNAVDRMVAATEATVKNTKDTVQAVKDSVKRFK